MSEEELLAAAQQQHQAGQTDLAEAGYRNLLGVNPDNPAALYGLAVLTYQSGRLDEAAAIADKLHHVAPTSAQTHQLIASIQEAQGDVEAALDSLENAAAFSPDNAALRSKLGSMHKARGNLAKAIEHYSAATRLSPEDEVTWSHLADAYWQDENYEEATGAFLTVMQLVPQQPYAHKNLGYALHQQGEYEAGLACYNKVLELAPSAGVRIQRDIMLPVILESEQQIDTVRERLGGNLDALLQEPVPIYDPVNEIGQTNFFLAYHGRDDKALQMKFADLYTKLCPSLVMTAGGGDASGARNDADKIRVGFLSKFFKNHSIGRTSRGIIEHLSRDRFEVVALFLEPPTDETAQAIADAADEVIVLDEQLEIARSRIVEGKLDILFYQDVGMDAFSYFLSFSRLAPVQCASFGHPETTGVPSIDHYISTELWEPEDGADHYSEKLVCLKDVASVAYYYKPDMPRTLKPRGHFSLSDEDHLYICPQALFKLHPEFDYILGGILRGDPAGRIVLVDGKYPHWSEVLQRRLEKTLPDVVDRIQFLPKQRSIDFINLIAVSDVMLDTIHFCGFNTTLEAIAAGVPVVTLPGRFMRGRHTAAFYRKMDIPECIADDRDDYIRKAIQLGTDRAYRDTISEKIRQSSELIWEEAAVVREFERVFENMVAPGG